MQTSAKTHPELDEAPAEPPLCAPAVTPLCAPAVTPLCESNPPRFASEAMGGRTTLTLVDAHRIEQDVQRALLALAGAHFPSLVVRRLNNGVCLQGYVEFDGQAIDLCEVARRISGVDAVVNHIVERSARPVVPR